MLESHLYKLLNELSDAKLIPISPLKAKVAFITLDEKSGTEKKSNQTMLVQAADLRDAVKRLDKGMEGTMADYEIAAIAETPIMDVFHYNASKNEASEFSSVSEL